MPVPKIGKPGVKITHFRYLLFRLGKNTYFADAERRLDKMRTTDRLRGIIEDNNTDSTAQMLWFGGMCMQSLHFYEVNQILMYPVG
ncbi:MAG: hypothetical protein CL946_08435 [Ectothiorhodospiraceae bacterium]|nr:hypothetical protein [Ectothiorhodospiraceae bacterium]